MTETPDLTFLSVINLVCVSCRGKKATFVCFCGQDVCLDCAISHQQGCRPAIDLQFKEEPMPFKKQPMSKKKWRRKQFIELYTAYARDTRITQEFDQVESQTILRQIGQC